MVPGLQQGTRGGAGPGPAPPPAARCRPRRRPSRPQPRPSRLVRRRAQLPSCWAMEGNNPLPRHPPHMRTIPINSLLPPPQLRSCRTEARPNVGTVAHLPYPGSLPFPGHSAPTQSPGTRTAATAVLFQDGGEQARAAAPESVDDPITESSMDAFPPPPRGTRLRMRHARSAREGLEVPLWSSAWVGSDQQGGGAGCWAVCPFLHRLCGISAPCAPSPCRALQCTGGVIYILFFSNTT